jgi:prepilin-type N-terminal cleavage/methylation domain-containing protein
LPPGCWKSSRGFTFLEVVITTLIISIIATIAVEAVTNSDAALRAERAAREAVTAIRFARMRAMADGTSYKVRFNVGAKTISVVDPANGNAPLAAPLAGGIFVINLSGKTDVANVAMACSIAGSASDPYDITFSPIGGTSNTGTVTFTYGQNTKVLTIPSVGDPTVVGDTRRP